MKSLFRKARKHAPCIVFIDERLTTLNLNDETVGDAGLLADLP